VWGLTRNMLLNRSTSSPVWGCYDRKKIARAALETAAVTAIPSDYPGNDAVTFIIAC
jgi:hypothetical protein